MNMQYDAWCIPDDMSLEEFVNSRIARFSTRRYDFSALKFQAEFAAKYWQAQMQWIATRSKDHDYAAVASEKFSFSTAVIQPQAQQAFYAHKDVEEVLFILRGCIDLTIEYQGKKFTTQLNERDLISIPPTVYRSLSNPGYEDAILCVMLGDEPTASHSTRIDCPISEIEIY